MRRGEIWTVAGGKDYPGKPRTAVILQDDRFDATDSITICAFTSDSTEAPLFRLAVDPSPVNGLKTASRLMADKITTVPKTKIGQRVGRLDDDDILRLNRAVLVFLGHIPIILLTALDRSDFHIRRGYSVGAMDYLYKPVIPAILRAKVSAFVDLYKKTEAVKRWEAERARTAEAAQARLISILEATPDLVAIAYPDGFANTLIAPDGDCSESTKTRTSARFD